MPNVRSDTEANTLSMTFSGEVTVANLARLERTAVIAARVLDREFVLVTDISDCTSVTESAIKHVDGIVDQLVQFGLTHEVRIVAEDTPESVRQAFDQRETDGGVAVDVVRADDKLSPADIGKASR